MKKYYFFIGVFITVATSAVAQLSTINYTTKGNTYSQNFDGLSGSGTAIVLATNTAAPAGPFDLSAAPVSASNITGWQVYRASGTTTNTQLVGGTGTSSSGSFFSFGAAPTATDRALGIGCASTYTTAAVGAVFTNNTGSTLTSFLISFTGEQWRTAGSATVNTWAFKYAIGTTAQIQDISMGTYTNETNLNFASPTINGGIASQLDGNVAANQIAKSFRVTGITWNSGDVLAIRWDDTRQGTGNQNHNAIDDFTFRADDNVSILPLTFLSFSGTVQSNKANLNFTTGNEENVKEIVIEKSTNATDYAAIASLVANNKNYNSYNYSTDITNQPTFFRLKSIDYNGLIGYSKTILLSSNLQTSINISASPNPAKNNIIIKYPIAVNNTYLTIINSIGKVVSTQAIPANSTSLQVNINNLSNGLYRAKVSSNEGAATTTFIKN